MLRRSDPQVYPKTARACPHHRARLSVELQGRSETRYSVDLIADDFAILAKAKRKPAEATTGE